MEQTRTCTLAEAFAEYRRNAKFRKKLETGCYVYTGEMFALNHPKIVQRENGKITLTEYALNNLPEYTLLFEFDTQANYDTFSEQVFDAPRVKKDLYFDSDDNPISPLLLEFHSELMDVQNKIKSDILAKMSDISEITNGYDMMGLFINMYDITADEFQDATELTKDAYRVAKGTKKFNSQKEKGNPSKIKVLTFAAGYDLPLDTTNIFLSKATREPIGTGYDGYENSGYAFVIKSLAGWPMDYKNKFLHEHEIPTLS